jgi:lipopolysaccharide transport system ATP-binding protein
MSELAVKVDNVSRLFKRYKHPRYQIAEALGLRMRSGSYDEFWALRDISLEIWRGERVGLIGRNGAGKTTLLSIICGRLKPTSGRIAVSGRTQVLMELGTGFHPEFTGRQNVLASLAYQGITGRMALEKLEDVFYFSELDDFIDQPVKTYSSGMYARLAFSTATCIEPEILIIDEVLGAGDAYFAAKSTERMQRLTRENGATVLFVSHDTTSIERLCDRCVWLDRGSIVMQGSTVEVSKAYYASIMEQEEARLRARTSKAVARLRNRAAPSSESWQGDHYLFRFITADGVSPRRQHPVRRIALLGTTGTVAEAKVGAAMDNDPLQPIYVGTNMGVGAWSRPVLANGTSYRIVGADDQNATCPCFYVQIPADVVEQGGELVIEHSSSAEESIFIEIGGKSGFVNLGALKASRTGWQNDRFPLSASLLQAAFGEPGGTSVDVKPNFSAEPRGAAETSDSLDPNLSTEKRDSKWDTRYARFLSIKPCNFESAKDQFVFKLREPISFRVVMEVVEDVPSFWIAVIVFDDRGNRVSLNVEKFENGLPRGPHEVIMSFEKPVIRQGEYAVSFEMLAEFDYYWKEEGRFPHYAYWDRCVFFKIEEHYRGIVELGRTKMVMSIRSDSATVASAHHPVYGH